MLYNLRNDGPKNTFDPSCKRDIDTTFGHDYFDGLRERGYGGYKYDGRWKEISKRIVERYHLKAPAKVLDIGCAKGFFLLDMMSLYPGIEAWGVDTSKYAVSQAPKEVQKNIHLVDQMKIPFKDGEFDFVMSVNTLHWVTPEKVRPALKEMMRVGKKNFFLQVDAYHNEEEKRRLLAWAPSVSTLFSVEEWVNLFNEVGYKGDYYWTII